MFALSINHSMQRSSIDVKIAFVTAGLEEDIYVAQAEGFIVKEFQTMYTAWKKGFMV